MKFGDVVMITRPRPEHQEFYGMIGTVFALRMGFQGFDGAVLDEFPAMLFHPHEITVFEPGESLINAYAISLTGEAHNKHYLSEVNAKRIKKLRDLRK